MNSKTQHSFPEKMAEICQSIVVLLAVVGLGASLYLYFTQQPITLFDAIFMTSLFTLMWLAVGGFLGFLAKVAGLTLGSLLLAWRNLLPLK